MDGRLFLLGDRSLSQDYKDRHHCSILFHQHPRSSDQRHSRQPFLGRALINGWRVQLYYFGPVMRANDIIGNPTLTSTRQMLSSIVGTTFLVLDIVHNWLKMICS